MANIMEFGDTTARPVGTESDYDPVYGPRFRDIWEGSEEDLQAQAALFLGAGLRAEVYPYEGPVYRMRVSLPEPQDGTTPFFETWERDYEMAQEDIRSNPIVIAAAVSAAGGDGSLGVGELNKWYKEAKENIKNGVWIVYANAARQAFSELLARGADAHEVDRILLRRRRLLHLNKMAQSQVLAVSRFYSTAAFISGFGLPAAIGNVLPANPANAPSNTAWGWKRRTDRSVATPALYKCEEVTEFVFAAWSTLLYEYVA